MWSFFVKHQKFTTVLVGALALAGLFSVTQLPKESSPEVNIPFIIVSTSFPDANALDVETFVTDKIENSVAGINGLKNLTSSSSLGFSTVALEFEVSEDVDEKLSEVKDAVDIAKFEFPNDANDPITAKVSLDDEPIKKYALSGPYKSSELRIFAEQLKEDLERVSNVDEVVLVGGEEREIQVQIDPRRLDQFELPLNQVVRAIQSANSNIPIGSIESSESNISVRFDGTLSTIQDFERIPITVKNGAPIFVSDIAEIVSTTESRTSASYLSQNNIDDGNPAVSIGLVKSPGGDILKLVKESDAIIDTAIGTTLPGDLTVAVIDDMAEFIRTDLTNLTLSGLQTTLIVTLLIFFTLGWREAILTALSIPLTFLITFSTLQMLGYTINFLTLFALILALGILVDGVIVMTEGIHTQIKKGLAPEKAAIATIKEFKNPLIAGTLTTIFAFAPMLLTSGIIGEYIKSIPVTVSIVLISSLFVALGVIPTFGAVLLSKNLKTSRFTKFTDKLEKFRFSSITFLQSRYEKILDYFLVSKMHKFILALALSIAFVGAIGMVVTGILKVDMFPTSDLDQVTVQVTLPQGTVLSVTEAKMLATESFMHKNDEIESYLISVGGSGSNSGSINIRLIEDRRDSRLIVDELEKDFTDFFPEGTVTVFQLAGGPPSGAPIEITVSGPDLITLENIATELKAIVESTEGTRSVQTSIVNTSGEFVYSINRAAVARYNISPTEVASTMRTALYGSAVSTLSVNGDDIDVVVKYIFNKDGSEQNAINIAELSSITMQTPVGDVPISTFLDTNLEPSQASIPHKDSVRIVSVTSEAEPGAAPQDIFSAVEEQLSEIDIPNEYEVQLGGQNDDIAQSFTDMAKAMVLGIFMIAALLILQFNSFKQPLMTLLSIPLSLIGVLPGLALVGQPLSFPGVIGVVALAGIVVNNGIILIDRINENRSSGMLVLTAVKEAANSRLRPIILTTITTVFGLMPLVISQPDWAPLGYAIIFGLIFSTVSTLIVVPTLYVMFEKDK